MAQRESKLSRRIMEQLRLEGWFCFKVHGSEFMMAGLNDIICCAEGYFMALETKNPEDRDDTSRIQEFRHDQIREAGGFTAVVCSPEEAVAVVRGRLRELARSKS